MIFSSIKKQCLKNNAWTKVGWFLQHTNASLRASYEVSLMIAKQKKAHTIGEDLVPGSELGGCQEGHCPPQNFTCPPKNFSGLFLKVLHRPLTAPLVAKLAPPVAPPNENVWLRPCLVLPAAKVMARYVFGDESVKKLNSISLSNNTVQRRIEEMSMDILQQVISEIRSSENGFAIQLDEPIDVINCA